MKLLLIADVHNKPKGSKVTLKKLENVIKKAECDLIIFLGDTVHGPDIKNNYERYLRQVLDLTNGKKFATVFGNHDDECNISKDEILSICSSYDNCLTLGKNYTLTICGETLLFIDSGSYYKGNESFYDVVDKSTIDWAKEQIVGKKAILFQHIIMPDIFNKIDCSHTRTKGACFDEGKWYKFKDDVDYCGYLKERPCPPDINTGEFSILKPYLKACCFGHDHKNTFEFFWDDVKFIQCGGSGNNSYDKRCKSTVKILDTKTLETSLIIL